MDRARGTKSSARVDEQGETQFAVVRSYDIAPDGERLVAVVRVARDETRSISASYRRYRHRAASSDLQVVTNWFQELTRLTAEAQ